MSLTRYRVRTSWIAMAISVVVAAMVAVVLPFASAAQAQSQNELLVNINWDGQAQRADSAFPGPSGLSGLDTNPCPVFVDETNTTGHTPGLDDSNCNGVVRTFDLVQYRVDYNVNEAGQTGVGITLQLPPNMTYITSPSTVTATFPLGMFPGCLANSTITSSGTPGPFGTVGTNDVLYCDVDQADNEGNNGTIYPTAQLLNEIDTKALSVGGTLTTTEDPAGVSDSVDIIASSAPAANFRKGIIEVDEGTILGYYGEEEYKDVPGPDGVTLGRIHLWPIDFQVVGGLLGSAPLDDTQDIVFYDHAYNITASAQLATTTGDETGITLLPDGRTACGTYDGSGKFPIIGTWTCEVDTVLSGTYGYPVTKITLVGGTWSASQLAALNANGTANTNSYTVGQIAFWAPDIEITGPPAKSPTIMYNSISNDTAQITDAGQVTPIEYWAASLAGSNLQPETTTADNDALFPFQATSTTPSGPGVAFQHKVAINPGPLQLLRMTDMGSGGWGNTWTRWDWRVPGQGGVQHKATCGTDSPGAASRFAKGECQLSRGQVITLSGSWATNQTRESLPFEAYINGCMAIDTTHIEIVSVPSAITVNETGVRSSNTPTLSSYTIAPSHGIAHATNGVAHRSMVTAIDEVTEDFGPGGDYVIEVATATPGYFAGISQGITPGANPTASTITTPYSISEHEVSCNNDNAATGWVDITGDLSAFDSAPANGTYDLINLVRVRSVTPVKWTASDVVGLIAPTGIAVERGAAITVHLGAQVKTDLYEQSAGQEIFVAASRNWNLTQWDPAAEPASLPTATGTITVNGSATASPPYGAFTRGTISTPQGTVHADCMSNTNFAGSAFYWNDEETTPSGWCNKQFNEFTTDESPPAGAESYDENALEDVSNGINYAPHVDKAYIVEANIALSKSNLSAEGNSQILDNGLIAEYGVNVSTVGSTLDELLDLELTDDLPANLAFVGFTTLPVSGPDTPGVDGVQAAPTCSHSGGALVNDPTSTTNPPAQIATGGVIKCDFGDRFGGWSDYVSYEVMVVGAEANTRIVNTAKFEGDRCGAVDPDTGGCTAAGGSLAKTSKAAVNTPGPFQEAAIIKTVNTFEGDCTEYPTGPVDAASLDPEPADWADRCEMVQFESAPANNTTQMGFVLEMANEGNTPLTNVRIVDVFPHVADEAEPPSATGIVGDGRTPETDVPATATLGLVSLAGDVTAYYVTGDPASSISRDPDATVLANTWCTPAGVFAFGVVGTCPAAGDETAIFAEMTDIGVGERVAATLLLESQGHECDDIWTNTFGARNAQTLLPIRSNDVSIMVNCEFDLALRKTLDPAWVPDAGWVTPGTSTVDFILEVHNQGNPINNFEVTDYIDPTMFSFAIGDNTGGNTLDASGLPYTWDNSGANPVVTINDPAHPLHDANSNLIVDGDIVLIPVTLTIAAGYEVADDLDNKAEISYFDNDADPANGDSASGDVVDVDSLPDASDGDTLVDDEIDEDITTGGLDEDDHDIASVPIWDLEVEKNNPTISQNLAGDWEATYDITVTNNSNATAWWIDVLDTPPPGLSYLSASPTGSAMPTNQGTTTVNDGHPTFEVRRLYAGEEVTWTVTYAVTDLTAGPYTNSVQIDSFTDNIDDDPPADTTVDADSTPGNDTDHEDPNEDDDDSETVSLPFDLALVKKPKVDDPAYPAILDGVQNGDEILFYVEVFNQLSTIQDFDVIDYLQPGWIFDPAAQVSPQTTLAGTGALGGPTLPYTWSSSGADPVALVTGVLPAGESVIIPIVLTADIPNTPVGPLDNYAEISRFDDDGDPSNGDSSDGTLTDIDSEPDGSNDDDLVDDAVGGEGDEDDHDIASTVWYDVALEKDIFDGTVCGDGPAAITAATTTVEYCITVTNEGPTDVHLVSFADTPPAGLTFNSTTVLPAGVTDNGAGSYTATFLAPGDTLTVQLDYTLDLAAVTGPLTNVAEVTEMFADEDGTDPAEDADSFPDEDPDSDAPTEDDEDDESLTIPYDLALTKTLGEIDGDQVTMLLTIENQSIPVQTVDITDYIDPTMWLPFDAALNPSAPVDVSSTAGNSFFFSWDATNPLAPVALVEPVTAGDMFVFGETVVVPITLTISPDWVGPDLDNWAEISNFDDDPDTPGDGADGTLPEADSTPDGEDGNGPGESFNSSDDETGEDGTDGGDEDDHDGVLVPIFDLALDKTLDPATVQPLEPGDNVTFLIEIINQGNTHATNPTLIDYVDTNMFLPFDPALNPFGATTGDQALAYVWAGNALVPANGDLTITGTLAPGESVTVPITLTINPLTPLTALQNTAEITGGVASDADGEEITDGEGNPLEDFDSDPDGTDDDTVVDGALGEGSDEDDHDIAPVIVAVPDIDIEKLTNDVQSDTEPGEQIAAGDPVTWSYVVENTGTTALADSTVTDSDPSVVVDCGDGTNVIALMNPGDIVTCTATGVATMGQYMNSADVSGTPVFPDPDTCGCDLGDPASWPDDPELFEETGQDDPEDADDSHYYGTEGGIELEKSTNLADADTAPGVSLSPGDPVVWSYVVTNNSAVALLDVTVADSDPAIIVDCGSGSNIIAVMLPGDVVTCTSTGTFTAEAGAYHNDSTVEGTGALPDPDACECSLDDPDSWPTDPELYNETGEPPYGDEDPSNYFALEGSLELEKATNGVDSDVAPGEPIPSGDAVTWTYIVTNNSNAAMTAVTVADSDPTVSVDCGDGTNVIDLILPTGIVVCEATGTAAQGTYHNDSTVEGQPSMPNPETCECDLDDPETWPTDPDGFISTGDDPSTDEDPSNYYGAEPGIDIEKDTNGDQADTGTGPLLAPGDPVTWTYVVENTGNVPLLGISVVDSQGEAVDCGDTTNVIALLLPGDTHTCTAEGTATLGQYENDVTTSGTPAFPDPDTCGCDPNDPNTWPDDPAGYAPTGDDPVTDEDTSHYLAFDGDIKLEKSTNLADADTAPGPVIAPGDPVIWTYAVTNTSDTPIVNAQVSDDQGVAVDCGDGDNIVELLLPGETHLCQGEGIATDGQYTNIGSVSGTPGIDDPDNPGEIIPAPGADPVTDEDPSNYLGAEPGLDIEKATNGLDSDLAPGATIPTGLPVVWTYDVTNTGDQTLIDVVVTDSQGETVDCGDGTNTIAVLAPGDTVTCEAEGTAGDGQYSNIGAVEGTPAIEDADNPGTFIEDPSADGPLTDEDPSNYTGQQGEPGLDLEKATNGLDSDIAPGATIPTGLPVVWTYDVTNTGDQTLIDVVVTDDQGETVDCGDGTNAIAVLAPGDTVTCEAEGIAGDGPYTNNASVEGTPALEDPDNPGTFIEDPSADGPLTDEDPSNYTGQQGDPGLDLEKATNGLDSDAAPGAVLAPGDPVIWTYAVSNTGDQALIDLVVNDDQGETVNCGNGSNTIALLLPGETVTCQAQGIAGDNQYTNTGSVEGTPAVGDPDNPGDYIADPAADGPLSDEDPSNYTGAPEAQPAPEGIFDLALVKTVAGGNADLALGDDVTFNIEVINQGDFDAINVTVIDYLGAGLTLNDPNWADAGNGQATILVPGPIPAGDRIFLDITATIVSSTGLTNAAEIADATPVDSNGNPIAVDDIDSTADSNNDDPTVDNVTSNAGGDEDDHDIANVELGTPPKFDLALLKKVISPGPFAIGDDVTFAIDVINQGDVNATNIEITDELPPGTTLNDPDWTPAAGNRATYTIAGPLAPNGVETIEITVTINSAGELTNTAGITQATPTGPDGAVLALEDVDSNPSLPSTDNSADGEIHNLDGDEDDSDPASISVAAGAGGVIGINFDLALAKDLNPDQLLIVGEDVTFDIAVTNEGDFTAANIQIIDYLPDGLALADSDWTATAAGATTTLDAPLQPGDTATVPITVTITDFGDSTNVAEIASAQALDANGNLFNIDDVDSTPDTINNDPASEDDHDSEALLPDSTPGSNPPPNLAFGTPPNASPNPTISPAPAPRPVPVPAARPQATPKKAPLAVTGNNSGVLLTIAIGLLAAGLTLMAVTRRRRQNN